MRTHLAKFIFGEKSVIENNSEITTDPATDPATEIAASGGE